MAKKNPAVKMTREDMEAAIRELCFTSVRLDETTARMNEALARVREQFEPELAALQQTHDELFDQANAWADAHPDEFATRKSITLVHGTMGYRTGQPALKTIRGQTWDSVLAFLKVNLPQYIRVVQEVDREALISDRETLGDENLKTLGMRVDQAERFFIDLNKEEIQAPARA